MINLLLFDKNNPDQAYHTKERPCPRGCGTLIYFESRFGENGIIITKDGKMPNGIFGKENNVKWFWIESLSKSEHLLNGICKRIKMTANYKTMESKYPATCFSCNQKIAAGDKINYYPDNAKGQQVSHPDCSQQGTLNATEKVPKTESGSANWETVTPEILKRWQTTIDTESAAEAVAVHIVKELHPSLSQHSQTFGMIVSAKEDKLIQIRKLEMLSGIARVLELKA